MRLVSIWWIQHFALLAYVKLPVLVPAFVPSPFLNGIVWKKPINDTQKKQSLTSQFHWSKAKIIFIFPLSALEHKCPRKLSPTKW